MGSADRSPTPSPASPTAKASSTVAGSADPPGSPAASLDDLRAAFRAGAAIIDRGWRQMADAGPGAVDIEQAVAYDLAHTSAAWSVAGGLLTDAEAQTPSDLALAAAFLAEALADLAGRLAGREAAWGSELSDVSAAIAHLGGARTAQTLTEICDATPASGLSEDFELVAETFRRVADDVVAPRAQRIHREDADVDQEIISALGDLGVFGLSIPEEFHGAASGDEDDYLGMVIATEELSRGSLAAGGSLITRPEILARALLKGGTEAQKNRWLPRLASGQTLVGVAVTEPDFGSDVAHLTCRARREGDHWVISGRKTWSTFAARADLLMLLARTDPDPASGHRGLSLFMVEKPAASGKGFVLEQPSGGRLEGRPIPTLGYRGMHSFDLSFDDWRVPADALIGEEAGVGRGFYLQMEGFENGRLQTVARAVGVMRAAIEEAIAYTASRRVFGQPLDQYQLTRVKIGRMVLSMTACRRHSYRVARMLAEGEGSLEASMLKMYACRAAEWITREAQQLHGGMGYAEEFPISRLFVDARVLSIFEGADETLALKVVARRLATQAGNPSDRLSWAAYPSASP